MEALRERRLHRIPPQARKAVALRRGMTLPSSHHSEAQEEPLVGLRFTYPPSGRGALRRVLREWHGYIAQELERFAQTRPHQTPPAEHPGFVRFRLGAQEEPLAQLVDDLAEEWERDTVFVSSVTELASHDAYQQIIGLGPQALPYILRRLQREPNQWFWALRAITREDPASGEGTVGGAAARWLEWGRAHGYLRRG
jgi:hypothetical protein